MLLDAFVGEGPLIVGIDETLERRYGKRISARGLYRDPVRSTHEWYSTGLFAVPVRWVLIRDPEGRFEAQALLFAPTSMPIRSR